MREVEDEHVEHLAHLNEVAVVQVDRAHLLGPPVRVAHGHVHALHLA